jgi:cytochrome bd-type quinol oxidase subunit 2
MSSPGARQRRRREQYQAPRSRREVSIAVGAACFIVAGTAFIIWMLRPGGMADRQPRSSWLFTLAFLAVVVSVYVILRPSSRLKVNRQVALAGAIGTIVVITALVGALWPHGLLRHTPKVTPFTPLSSTQAPPTGAPSTTSAPGSTVTPSTKSSGATTGSSIP